MDEGTIKQLVDSYKKLCKQHQTDYCEAVIQQLQSLETGSTVMDLSRCNLSSKSCAVIGDFLSTDNHYSELRVTDCMLPEEGVKELLNGLCKNMSLRMLNLKGNNLKGSGALYIGKLLKQNCFLKRVLLEWNVLGLSTDAIGAISDGLASNSSLVELDLSHNQINHVGAATLAGSLRLNTTLEILDLRWNNIGLLGGRALLEMLKTNRALKRMDLGGNNVHADVLKALETAIRSNLERYSVIEHHLQREEALNIGLRQMESAAQRQLRDVLMQMEKQQEGFEQSHRMTSSKIGRLQETLEERKGAFKTLEAKLEMHQSSLAVAEQQKRELGEELRNTKSELDTLRQQHLNILRQSREEHSEREQVLLSDLRTCRDQIKELDAQVTGLKKENEVLHRKLAAAEEETSSLQQLLKTKIADAEDQHSKTEQHYRSQIKDLNIKLEETEHSNRQFRSEMQDLQNKFATLQGQKQALKEEVSLTSLRRAEERGEVDRRQRQAQAERDELEKSLSSWASKNRELMDKIEKLQADLENQRKVNTNLSQVVVSKEEAEKELAQARSSIDEKQRALNDQSATSKVLADHVKKLEKQLEDEAKAHACQLQQAEAEVASLQAQIQLKEEHWRQLNEREAQRTALLHSAIGAYLEGGVSPSKRTH